MASNDCLPYEKSYFFRESTFLVVSAFTEAVSTFGAAAVSIVVAVLSGFTVVVSVAVVESALLLQATKPTTEITIKSFFILKNFLIVIQ